MSRKLTFKRVMSQQATEVAFYRSYEGNGGDERLVATFYQDADGEQRAREAEEAWLVHLFGLKADVFIIDQESEEPRPLALYYFGAPCAEFEGTERRDVAWFVCTRMDVECESMRDRYMNYFDGLNGMSNAQWPSLIEELDAMFDSNMTLARQTFDRFTEMKNRG